MLISRASTTPKHGHNSEQPDDDSDTWRPPHDNYKMHTNWEWVHQLADILRLLQQHLWVHIGHIPLVAWFYS